MVGTDALSVRKMDIGDVDLEECTEEAADVAGEDEPALSGMKYNFEPSFFYFALS